MARQTLCLTLCLLACALSHASDESLSSASDYDQQLKDDEGNLTTTPTITTTTTTAKPRPLNLEKFVADKIAAAVEEVEEAYKTRREDGETFGRVGEGEEPFITDAMFPEGWSTPAAFPPFTTEASSPPRDDPHADHGHEEDYSDFHEHDENTKAQHEDDSEKSADYADTEESEDFLTTPDFASQMQKDHSSSHAQEHPGTSEKPFNEKLVNRPRWYILREIAEDNDEGKKEDEAETDKNAESTSDTPGWPQNRPQWDMSPDNLDSDHTSHDGFEHSDLSPEDHRNEQEKPAKLDKKDRKGKGARDGETKRTRPAHKRHSHRRKWRTKKRRPTGRDCVGCTKHGATISQARKLHTQVLKAQLLDKLRLVPTFKKRPWPPKLPDQVFPDPPQRDHTGYDDQYYAKPTQLLVFGRDLGPHHRLRKAGTGSYQFGVTGKVKGHVTSADLWVYKMKDAHDVHGQTLVITDLHFSKRRRLRERSLVARLDTHVEEGWVRFDVTRLVQRWLKGKTPASLQMLAIRCKTCHRTNYRAIFGVKSNFRPVLVMQEHREDEQSRRERREACDPNTRCCKFDLTVHFHDLGVHEIFHPRSIKADYCYGFCERPDAYYHNHTLIIQRLRFGSYAPLEEEMFERLRPCCVPVVLREASIMHYINDGLDTQVSVVPNLLVEKCGCA